jgi:hypothetical protein
MADETVVRQQAAQIGVAAEQDAVEIERLALEPIRGIPHVVDGVDDGPLVVRAKRLQAQPMVMRDRQQVVDDRESSCRTIRRLLDVLDGRGAA